MQKNLINIHQHDIATFNECRKKFDLSFNRKIFPRKISKFLQIGDLFAQGTFYLHRKVPLANCCAYIDNIAETLKLQAINQEHINEIETDKIICIAMLIGYEQRFMEQKLNILPEYRIEIPIRKKYLYIMRLDGRIKSHIKENWVLEIKSTFAIEKDQITRLPCDFQIKSYCWGLEKWTWKPVIGILYRFIRKPSIKQKQNETIEQFQKRLQKDYVEREDFYFYEEKPLLDRNILNDFEEELYQIFDDLTRCYKTNHWYKTALCGKTKFGECPYFKYCSDPTEETLETFYEKR